MENQVFGRWTVVLAEGRKWLCRCSCGTEKAVARGDLRAGKSKSCGCLSREMTGARSKIAARTHGMEGSTEYRIWVDMRRRCHSPQRADFKNYGARGITVCDRWRESFSAFYADMGPRPEGHTLDRKENSLGYSPANCVWSPRKAQERNKRSNRMLTIRGERMTMVEAAERFPVVGYYTIASRLHLGWDEERAVLTPARHHKAAT